MSRLMTTRRRQFNSFAASGGVNFFPDVVGQWDLTQGLENQGSAGSSYDMTLSGATRDGTDGLTITNGQYCRTSAADASALMPSGAFALELFGLEFNSLNLGEEQLMSLWDSVGNQRGLFFQHQNTATRTTIYELGSATPVTVNNGAFTWPAAGTKIYVGLFWDGVNTAYWHAGTMGAETTHLGSFTLNYPPFGAAEPLYLGSWQGLNVGLQGKLGAARITHSDRGVSDGTFTPDSLPLPTS